MESKVDGMETVCGGAVVVVELVNGGKEEVKVKQLAVKDYPRLLELQGDEVELVAFYCGKERAWAEGLAPAYHEKVIAEGERLNGDFFGRWFQRQTGRLERIRPGLADKVWEGVDRGGQAVRAPLPSSAPKSPSSAG